MARRIRYILGCSFICFAKVTQGEVELIVILPPRAVHLLHKQKQALANWSGRPKSKEQAATHAEPLSRDGRRNFPRIFVGCVHENLGAAFGSELKSTGHTASGMCIIQLRRDRFVIGIRDCCVQARTFPFRDVAKADVIDEIEQRVEFVLMQRKVANKDAYAAFGSDQVALEEVDPHKVSRYGIAGGDEEGEGILSLNQLIEKPSPGEAPSNLAIAARYVFQPEIFNYISMTPRGKNNEVQLTDAMVSLLQNHGMYGLRLSGKRHDIGNKLDFIKANVELGLQRTDISSELASYLRKTVAEL